MVFRIVKHNGIECRKYSTSLLRSAFNEHSIYVRAIRVGDDDTSNQNVSTTHVNHTISLAGDTESP
jgi:hypothetical protein